MNSKDQIKQDLIEIVAKNGYSGESLDLVTDLLTYYRYHNQVEIMNAFQEKSLSTAKLMNSKITLCMDIMYSIYRGVNARVKLNIKCDTLIKKNKFDLLFESNTLKVYAASALNLIPTQFIITEQGQEIEATYEIEGILSLETKKSISIIVDSINKYYIDAAIDERLLRDLSEDLKITINGVEFQTTRNFYDHVNQSDGIEKLFILTIPDFGIRIFRKGYFEINSIVVIECFKYTESDDINPDEFNKIMLLGTSLVSSESIPGGRLLVDHIERESGSAILYNANYSTRTQSQILSISDINILFTEYFISRIKSSINWYKNGSLNIYYVPRITGDKLTTTQISDFIQRYGSYFITRNILGHKGIQTTVYVSLTVKVNEENELLSDLESIFEEYSNKLPSPNLTGIVNNQNYDLFTSDLNYRAIYGAISKLDKIAYVEWMEFSGYKAETGETGENYTHIYTWLPPTALEESLSEEVPIYLPTYYNFQISVNYVKNYDTPS